MARVSFQGVAFRRSEIGPPAFTGFLASQQVIAYCDIGNSQFTGIVYHASFLRFMERGRTEYMRVIGAAHRDLFEATAAEAPGFSFVVRSMRIDYLKPAHMDDVLEIVTEPEEVKGASVTLMQRVTRKDEPLVEAHVRVAFVAAGRARPIPKPLRVAMQADRAQASDTVRAPR